jgi:hypothetical protein
MKTQFVAFILILFACVLPGCSENVNKITTSTPSDSDSVKIAKAVLEDTALSRKFYERYAKIDTLKDTLFTYMDACQNFLDSAVKQCTIGKYIPWDVARIKIMEFEKRFRGRNDPVYVEFDYTCLEELVKTTKNSEEGQKIRAYFSVDTAGGYYYPSMVFVPTVLVKDWTPEIYTDTYALKLYSKLECKYVYDLGSPCPPGCETGRARPNEKGAPNFSTGATMARAAYDNAYLPCCLLNINCSNNCQ